MYDEFESIVRALSERGARFERSIARRRVNATEARAARVGQGRSGAKPAQGVPLPEPASAPALPDFGPPTEPLTVVPQPRYSVTQLPDIVWGR